MPAESARKVPRSGLEVTARLAAGCAWTAGAPRPVSTRAPATAARRRPPASIEIRILRILQNRNPFTVRTEISGRSASAGYGLRPHIPCDLGLKTRTGPSHSGVRQRSISTMRRMTVAAPALRAATPRNSAFPRLHFPRTWSLARQYFVASLLVVLAGVVVTAAWIGHQIESSVLDRTA